MWKDSQVAGVVYLSAGSLGVALNLAVVYLIMAGGEKGMRNATYRCMVQLALGEAESLLANMLIPGVVMTLDPDPDPPDALLRTVTFLDEAGFRATNYWMILIALTRWLTFARAHWLAVLFSERRHRITCALVWLSVHALHSPILFYPDSVVPGLLDYQYTNSTYSRLLNASDWAHDLGSALAQIALQAMTLAWIVNMRHKILCPRLRARNRVELRLFAQCSLDSIVYCSLIVVANTDYIRDYRRHRNTRLFYLVDALLFFNHVDCALFYFCFNRAFRRSFVSLLSRSGDHQQQGQEENMATRSRTRTRSRSAPRIGGDRL